MEETLLESLVAWGVYPETAMTVSLQVRRETARIAAIVAMRELKGYSSPSDRTQIEKEAIACVESQLDKVINAYAPSWNYRFFG